MVRRQTLMVLAVALLLSVAGCTDSAQSDGPGDNESTPSGYDKAGSDLDGATLENSTVEAVEQAGSYTFQRLIVGESEDPATSVRRNETLQVDFDAKRGLRSENVTQTVDGRTTDWTVVEYTADTASYWKTVEDGRVRYSSRERDQAHIWEDGAPLDYDYAAAIDGFAWEKQDTTEFRGTTVTRYAVTGVANDEELVGEETTIEDANGTLFVDADGVVHRLSASATLNEDGTTTTSSVTYTLSNVGSTTVEEPDWLSEAKSS